MAGMKENLVILTPLNFKEDKTSFEGKNVNINENVEKYDPLIFCRTCANIDSCFVPIFKDEGIYYDLTNKIEKYLPIKVSEKDDLPVQICYHCASTIIAWDNLLLGCVEAEKKLTLLKNSLRNECKQREESNKDELVIQCVDSDDEPLLAKKTSELLNKIEEKREILQEKNDLQALKFVEVASERRSRRIPARSNRKISPHGNDIHDENFKKSRKCSKCGKLVFRSLKKHMKIHHTRSEKILPINVPRKCPVCRKTHRDLEQLAEDLYSHVVNDLPEGSDKWNPNVCKICNTAYELIELPDHILLHIDPAKKENRKIRKKQIGEEEGKLTCDICGKTISKKYAMKRHLATHTGEKKYTCHHCGKQYAQESGLQRHVLAIHKGVRKYKCPICSKVFGTNSELKSHQDTHIDPRPFQCDQCGRTFISQKHLYHHRKYHHTANGMRQLCNICNRYFSSPSVLRRHHKVVHLGLKEFQCHICSAQLSTKHYLQEHLRLHSDERPEVCSFCGKTFQVTGNLRQHMKTHMGKTQVCYVCGKGFTRRCHLLIHMGSHRGLEHPQCQRCNQVFILKSDFEKHMKKEHGEKISDAVNP